MTLGRHVVADDNVASVNLLFKYVFHSRKEETSCANCHYGLN